MTEKEKGDNFVVEDIEEQEKGRVLVPWKPRLITGGKGPTGSNWLIQLTVGSVFLVKPKASGGFALGQFHLLHKLDKACHLMDNLTTHTETHLWVDPAAFSSQFDLVTILYEPTPVTTEDDTSN
jgi:hypothetical protein